MPKKSNGFFIFMKETQNKISKKSGTRPSMTEVQKHCTDLWKALSSDERKRYEKQAEMINEKPMNNLYKQANQSSHSGRVNVMEQERKMRDSEIKELITKLKINKNLKDMRIAIIDFQVLFEDPNQLIPREIGLVWVSLNKGIDEKTFHYIIDTGDPPMGYRGCATSHSERTHKIPLDYTEGETDIERIWSDLEAFLGMDKADEFPTLFCLSKKRSIVQGCLEFLYDYGTTSRPRGACADPDMPMRLLCLDDLISAFITINSEKRPNVSHILEALCQTRWDYKTSLSCEFHALTETPFCSLNIAKRLSFAMFDQLSHCMDFALTLQHMPEEKKSASFRIIQSVNPELDKQQWQKSGRLTPPFYRESSYISAFKKLQIKEDSEEDNYDDDDEDDTLSQTKCSLPEIRPPINFNIVTPKPADHNTSDSTSPRGQETTSSFSSASNLSIASSRPIPLGSIRPLPGTIQPTPGTVQPSPWSIRPPPASIRPPPGFPVLPGSGLLPNWDAYPHQSNPMAGLTGQQMQLSVGRGRGRGLLPQKF